MFSRVKLAAIALCALGCGSDCTEMGCVPGVFAQGTVETQSQRLRGDVCLAGRCASAAIDVAAGACERLMLSSDARLCVEPGAPGQIEVSLDVRSIGGELAFTDGDPFTLTLVDRDSAAVVVSVRQNLDYQEEYPNGPDCDDQPCPAASVTF